VREARTWAVMSAYNKVNGTWCSENPRLLLEILKGEWGFDGIVISDWFGTYTPGPAAGGLDLEMPGPARWMGAGVADAVRQGTLDEAVVDEHVRRLLRIIDRAGAFEHPEEGPECAIDKPEHRQVARQAAAEAIVLLKNDGGLLPFDPAQVQSIAVIGDSARRAAVEGGGSTHVFPHYVVTPLDAIRERAGKTVEVGYAVGCPLHVRVPVMDADWLTAEDGTAGALTATFYNTPDLGGTPVHTMLTRRLRLSWFDGRPPGVDTDLFSFRLSGTLRVPESGRYTLSLLNAGRSRLLLDGAVLIDAWGPYQPKWLHFDQGHTEHPVDVALEAGRVYGLVVEYSAEGATGGRSLQLGALPPLPDDPIGEAVALAARSDVAIVVAGLTAEWESEGFDRGDMELPRDQARLIEAVAAANPRTVVVLNAGSPLAMRWLDKVPAVVQAWYGGQEAGHALADVLFGDVCPSGRLPTTFPRRLEDNPAYVNYPGENGRVYYGEGLFVGYRYYDKKDVAPLFPFGYGLSYTTFAFHSLALNAEHYAAGEAIEVRVEVENTGAVAGQEVVQLYVRDVVSSLARPDKELKAFAKVALEPGERKTVVLTLGPEALSFYDPARAQWVAEPGEFEVIAAASARDVRLSRRFVLEE
jgi:beta-glucosidase